MGIRTFTFFVILSVLLLFACRKDPIPAQTGEVFSGNWKAVHFGTYVMTKPSMDPFHLEKAYTKLVNGTLHFHHFVPRIVSDSFFYNLGTWSLDSMNFDSEVGVQMVKDSLMILNCKFFGLRPDRTIEFKWLQADTLRWHKGKHVYGETGMEGQWWFTADTLFFNYSGPWPGSGGGTHEERSWKLVRKP